LNGGAQIKFIGTGSGRTSLKRNHSSFIINSSGFNLLIECGDGISKALLTADIEFDSINAILLSHLHPDHIAGLTSLLVQMKQKKRERPLVIYVFKDLIHQVKQLLSYQYQFPGRYKFDIRFNGFDYDIVTGITPGINFIARSNSHLSDLIKDSVGSEISFSSSSFLFEINNRPLFYTGDIGYEKDLYLFNDYDVELMISETTHVNPSEITNAFRALKAKELYLTHFSDDEEERIISGFKSLKSDSAERIIYAFDGLTFFV
jgi:ribonuclease BN (tRNA processing enzyme)